MTEFTITVPGKPVGKARPRFANGRTFTPKETVLAEQGIRSAWEDAGSPRLPDDGPVALTVVIGVERPRSHYTSRGVLNAQGQRQPVPYRQKPDADNCLKLVMDALNTRAWKDDVQIADATVVRRWAKQAHIKISAIAPLADEDAA